MVPLKKKIISIISAVFFVIAVSILISVGSSIPETPESEIQLEEKADVIMPTKVSRPGCEKIDHCYVPSIITINKGESVTWKNEDSAFHSVTSGFYDEPTELFDSGYLDPYQTFSFMFEASGTYDYYCTLHPWMAGQVIVN